MRVMYLSATGEIGGAERLLLDLLAAVRLAQPSWPLHLVAAGDGPLLDAARALGATAAALPLPERFARVGEAGVGNRVAGRLRLAAELVAASAALAAFVARLRRLAATFRPDVVHSHGLKMHLPGAWTAGSAAAVWHLHDYVTRRHISARLLQWNARFCSAAIAPSQSVAVDARRSLGDRVRTVINGIDLERFSPIGPRLDLDALSGLPAAPPATVRVGLIGTFARWKGHTTFLDALARLPAGGESPVRGYIIGAPVYRTEGSQFSLDDLRSHAERTGLGGRVGFTGFVSRSEDAARALDIVVHASTEPEPFGLVIAEAMACGRAIVASDAGGAAELVTPGVDGMTHPAGDETALANRIAELAVSSEMRGRLGAAARSTAVRRFDRNRMAAEVLDIYRQVAG